MNLQFQFTAKEAWQAQLVDCRNAAESIDVENYIFTDSAIGKEFLDLFKDKAGKGIPVRMLLDMCGSIDLFRDPKRLLELKTAGVEIRFFNPVSNWKLKHFWQWFSRRDHRKFLLIDRKAAHIGSACIDEPMSGWLEANVRLEGGAVSSLAASFDNLWRTAHKKLLSRKVFDIALSPGLFYVSSTPYVGRHGIHRALLNAINSAQKSIGLVSPYFVPTERMQRALRRAMRRGVVVKIIVPENSDLWVIDLATHEHARRLSLRGAEVRFSPRVVHAKQCAVDGRWAMMGSANFDHLSLLNNYEHVLTGEDPNFVAALVGNFESLWAEAAPLAPKFERTSLKQRLFSLLAYPIHRFL